MNTIPANWKLVEEWDNNYIFENSDSSFSVNISYTKSCEPSYSIEFTQQIGDFNMIGFEDGAYSTNSNTVDDAILKAFSMMQFINTKTVHRVA
jgi:hypothetical protein